MRPINKGTSPYREISNYSEALPYLERRIGVYCSYCEFRIDHVPEVEHISSKSKGGDRTDWNNLLLACKYCNSRKSKKTSADNIEEYLWPDTDNTAIAFSYENGIPRINRKIALQIDPSERFLAKAQNLFNLVKLGHRPTQKEKDRRFNRRNEVYRIARGSLETWESISDKEDVLATNYLQQTIELAKQVGFFSIWMMVFHDYPTVLQALLLAFPGTERTYFDEMGHPKLDLPLPSDSLPEDK